ncbi:hypothetical protein ES703_120582 [subsurface metagenome]
MTTVEDELLKGASVAAEKYDAERVKVKRGKGVFQRDMEELDNKIVEVRRQYNPVLLDIEQKYLRTQPPVIIASRLICPKCKRGDQGNRMNGNPWCFNCNSLLVNRKRVKGRK